MKQSAMLTDGSPARARAFRLFGLALLLLALALALPAGALADALAGAPAPAPPTISDINPHNGAVGTIVTVWGSGLRGATLVELGPAPVGFAALDDNCLQLTVPAGAVSGPISVTTPGGSAVSAQSFSVTAPVPVIGVTAPTGKGSYAQGSSLTVSWTTSSAVANGEFGVGVRSPAGGWNIGKLVPAGGATIYTTGLTLDVPVGRDYKVTVAWRPDVGSGPWGAYATSPGSFTVTTGNAKAITAFGFQGPAWGMAGVINEAAHTISVTIPPTWNLHALVADFTTTGESVAVGRWTQISGVTANDFSRPVTYTVTAFDGSTQDYTVSVHVLPWPLPAAA